MFHLRTCRRRTIARCSCSIGRSEFATANKQGYRPACCVRRLFYFFGFGRLCIAFTLLVVAESCSSPPRPTTTAATSAGETGAPKHLDGRPNASLPGGAPAARALRESAAAGSAVSAQRAIIQSAAVSPREDLAVPPTTGSPRAFKWQDPSQVGLVSDGSDGAIVRIGADLHLALDLDRLSLRTSDSGGPLRTLHEIMHRPGADIGIVQADALESLVLENPSTTAPRHLRFVARIYDRQVHVVAREPITDIRQLSASKVNIDEPGSGSHVTARLVFQKLAIEPVFTTYPTQNALDRLRSGEIDAAFIVAPSPAPDLLGFEADGFHFLNVPWDGEAMKSYSRAELRESDYPTLIRGGENVQTISVGVVVAVYNWHKRSRGYRKLVRFVRSFYSRLEQLQQPGHHFDWKDVDVSGQEHGWERFHFEEVPRRRGLPLSHEPTAPLSAGRADKA